MITREWLEAEKKELELVKIQLIAHLNMNAGKIGLIEKMLEFIEAGKEGDDGRQPRDED